MKQIIKNEALATSDWQVIQELESADTLPSEGNCLLPLALWNEHRQALEQASPVPGLILHSDQHPSQFMGNLQQLPLIAIDFPVFTDGRGYSLAAQLRDHYEYQGELRAIGAIHRDQLYMLKRCGFNSFEFDKDIDLQAALASLHDFSNDYQSSADQEEPLFLRR